MAREAENNIESKVIVLTRIETAFLISELVKQMVDISGNCSEIIVQNYEKTQNLYRLHILVDKN